MKQPAYFATLALALGLLGAPMLANAQAVLPQAADGGGKGVDPKKVYDVVEQMPTLPDGGGERAIAAAVQQLLVLPAGEQTTGLVSVEVIVDRTGKIRDAKVLQAPSPALGSAVLAAVAKLPTLKPGKQNGQATNVRLRLPIHVVAKP
jgi:TonB family protein